MARQWVDKEVCAVRCLCLRWVEGVEVTVVGMADLGCRVAEVVMVRLEVGGIDDAPRENPFNAT